MRDHSPASAASAVLRRRTIRQSLLEWSRHCGFEPAAHHRLLIQKLTDVAEGKIRNLMIFMPPGAGKSIYSSVLFPAWYLAQYPDRAVLAASHTVELAEQWGRKVRGLINEHGLTLAVQLSKDSLAAGRWSLKSGGGYFAVGVGSAVVGYRADIALIDDPVAGAESADSKVVRDRTYAWYKSELATRLKPKGATILIMTRWSVDDLAGRLLAEKEQTGEPWEVISLPAEAKEEDPLGRQPGDFLWGDNSFGYAAKLPLIKKSSPPRVWGSLNQQSPVLEEGNFFERQWLRPYTEAPPGERMHIYGASDFAVTENSGDWTVHIIIGLDNNNRMYLLDLWRKRTSTDKWIDSYCDLVLKWKPLEWAFEAGQIKSSVGPFLERRARERRAYCHPKTFPSRYDKSVRAQSIRGRMALDGLFVPTQAHWYSDFENELLVFPAGANDDIVDSLSLIGQMLTRITAGRVPETKAKLKVLTVGDPETQEAISLEELFELADYRSQRIRRI